MRLTSFIHHSFFHQHHTIDYSIYLSNLPLQQDVLFHSIECLSDDDLLQYCEESLESERRQEMKKENEIIEEEREENHKENVITIEEEKKIMKTNVSSSTTDHSNPLITQLTSLAEEMMQYLQEQSLLPQNSTLQSLHSTQLVYLFSYSYYSSDLVDFLQNQLSITTSSISITQTSAILTPLRGCLQAVVSLHALLTLLEGFAANEEERMIEYCKDMIENESYQRILPSSLLSLFSHISTLQKFTEEKPNEIESLNKIDRIDEKPNTTIIIDDSLLQQYSLLQ